MRKTIIRAVAIAPLALALAGCKKDVLAVKNYSNPDVARVYATPASIEGVIGTLYQSVFAAAHASSESINTQSKALSLETYGSVANFGMNTREGIPRIAIDNSRSGAQAGNANTFNLFSRASRTAATAVLALDALTTSGGTLGTPAQNTRARAFGFLAGGLALGYLSLSYDSAAVVTPQVATDVVPALSSYADVNKAALALIDTAIALAQSASATNGANGFPLPTAWLSTAGTAGLTQAQFVGLARAHKARIRAGVARTPAERQAVDWTAVIADATNGITADHLLFVTAGWACAYDCSQMEVSAGWGQISPMYYGMADTSGFYATWIGTPISLRDPAGTFVTSDRRWPNGGAACPGSGCRAAQTAASALPLAAGLYFRNKPSGEDVSGDPWGTSNYIHSRWWPFTHPTGAGGNYPFVTKAEMDMLAAEGYIRTSNFTAALTLINASRTKNGLPAIGAITSLSQKIGALKGCTPQVPQPPAFNTVDCGNIMEAMKYEKRMETAFAGFMQWFVDSRGWGDLVEGTALHWPVPNGEMDARVQPFYSLGGLGGVSAAPKGTYGF
jgi:hypothetical protein